MTDPIANHVYVMDTSTETEVGAINIPGAYGIDDTPDHKTIYFGTLIGDVYAIDAATLTVTKRYLGSQIGPYGYSALNAYVLADGRLALLGQQGGIPSVDGSTSFGIWNPADNSFMLYGGTGQIYGTPLPCGGFMGNIGAFTRTADRAKIVLASIDSDATVCEVDPTSGAGNYIQGSGFTFRLTMSPDGNYLVLPSYSGGNLAVYDAHTLNITATFNVNGDLSSAAGPVFSADSKTLYVPSSTIVYAYSLASHQQVGWFPNLYVPPSQGGGAVGPIENPNFQFASSSGLLFGPMEEGVGFVDAATIRTGAVGTAFTNGYVVPANGLLSGGTAVQWSDPNPLGTLQSVYFGGAKASAVSASGGYIHATSPAGHPGPADVYAFTNDGGMQLLAEAFSYGPTILQVTPNMSTSEGGGVGFVYGYGLGPVTSNTIPSDLRITVGGMSASITGFFSNAYGTGAPPFPLQAFSYIIPAGAAGSVANVVVTNNSGSSTASASFTYLPALQKFSLAGSLAQGIYDSHRDVYYFTDTNKVQIFSRTQGKWLTPITIPGPPGLTQRLWGIALSPDGSKMAVSDASAGVIYLVDPANPLSVTTFTVGSQGGIIRNPSAVAISNSGNIYYTLFVQGVTGETQFFKLNTSNSKITDYGFNGPGEGIYDAYLRTAISSDNSRVYFNELGYIFNIDTATDKVFSATTFPGCCYGNYELALSSNQTQFTATGYIYDSDLNGEAFYSLNDREISSAVYVYGAKLSPDGSLLFQPASAGIDVLDGRLGNLLTRVALPVSLSPNYDALVADGRDNILVAITGSTGNGIAVVDLTSILEPGPLPYDGSIPFPTNQFAETGAWWRSETFAAPKKKSDARPLLKRPRTVPFLTKPPF